MLDGLRYDGEVHDILMAIWPARFASDKPEDETPLGEDGIGLDSVEIAEFLMACEDRSGVGITEELFAVPSLTVGRVKEYFKFS